MTTTRRDFLLAGVAIGAGDTARRLIARIPLIQSIDTLPPIADASASKPIDLVPAQYAGDVALAMVAVEGFIPLRFAVQGFQIRDGRSFPYVYWHSVEITPTPITRGYLKFSVGGATK